MRNRLGSGNQVHEFFYIPPDRVGQDRVYFGPNESRHILRVLRHRKGDHIFASDGRGTIYHLVICRDDLNKIEAEIVESTTVRSDINFILSVGLLKGKRMDYVIEKSTELGVSNIIPMLTRRTVVKHLGGVRRIRLERIAMAAMKQSRGAWLPEISDVAHFDTVVDLLNCYDLVLIAHPGGDWRPGSERPSSIMIMVGPEGGFTDHEIEEAIRRGAQPLDLGYRRLRSDTAAVVSLARVMAFFDRKGGEENWPA
ncbi:MAG TPA: 16S rRNA (uracil(1498)-N(3))-methyltransferase [bacterium (Candidatus Stahlbacteria)]|nr:16S rRNA (uracil(1498)-N(3))-methyltransferase [Candidatus Stahlbacteria bacterium]